MTHAPTTGPVSGRPASRLAAVRGWSVAALAVLLLGGCGTPAGGDPGGKRLHELAADPVFASLPPGSTTLAVTRTPARHRQPDFTAGGWEGPSVVIRFTSRRTPAEVFRFVARRAEAAGWRGTKRGGLGLVDTWAKTYPDGAAATLSLTPVPRARPVPRTVYSFAGAIAPVVG